MLYWCASRLIDLDRSSDIRVGGLTFYKKYGRSEMYKCKDVVWTAGNLDWKQFGLMINNISKDNANLLVTDIVLQESSIEIFYEAGWTIQTEISFVVPGLDLICMSPVHVHVFVMS